MQISIIIPSYNRANLLDRAVRSVIKQSITSFEIIIVDDASTDSTQEKFNELEQTFPKVIFQFITHPKNKGEAGARNTGIRAARGEFIAYLDSDDEWLPGKLKRQLAILESTSADAVTCENYIVTNNDYATAEAISFPNHKVDQKSLLTKGCSYGIGSNFLFRRAGVLATKPFDETLKLFVDMDWLYDYLKSNKLVLLREPFTYYHKAPMRSGDMIDQACKIFLQKYAEIIKSFSFADRRRTLSCFNWYVGLGYDQNNQPMAAFKYFIKGLFYNPFKHPGSYYHIFKLPFKSIRSRQAL